MPSDPPADLVAAVGQLIATYTHALDDGRVDDVVATFSGDGRAEMPGLGSPEGPDALREAYARVAPRAPQRHLVSNPRILAWDDDEATVVSDVVFLSRSDDGWAVRLVGRYDDVVVRTGAGWRFRSRRAEFS